mmetsp:Transcript_15111/g.21016  ORF Transcript_15111/g.21016 Transcript_15111/m.21016 type:complete len:82 (+) Transcript_15111:2-247(+)
MCVTGGGEWRCGALISPLNPLMKLLPTIILITVIIIIAVLIVLTMHLRRRHDSLDVLRLDDGGDEDGCSEQNLLPNPLFLS